MGLYPTVSPLSVFTIKFDAGENIPGSSSVSTINYFVLFSITLGIASVLGISAMQKQRQLGILKAMGTTNLSSSLIFLFQGQILGITGAVMGALMVSLFMATAGKALTFRFDISPAMIFSPSIFAIIAAAAGSLLPAKGAGRLSPIEVIRNG